MLGYLFREMDLFLLNLHSDVRFYIGY